jgi:hypothetical protein
MENPVKITFAAVLLASFLVPLAALADITFVAQIDNAQAQAAGNCLIGSTAQGSGTATYDPATRALSWTLRFGNNAPNFDNGLLDQGAELFAHFHIAPPGVNGGVAVTLNNGTPKQGNTVLTVGQGASLEAGDFYINIHSAGCGSGEIRGQLVETQVPALPLWGAGIAAAALIAGAARLRVRSARGGRSSAG